MEGNVEIISKSCVWGVDFLMILVLLGTQNNSFSRLLEEVERCINSNIIKEEVIVQAGYTKFKSKHMKIFDLISTKKLEELQDKANIIITHGGVGSIVSSIKKGKKVIAIPRLHKYGEHVNDHQKEIVNMFGEKKYIIACNEVSDLENALKKIETFLPEKYKCETSNIINIIESYINDN